MLDPHIACLDSPSKEYDEYLDMYFYRSVFELFFQAVYGIVSVTPVERNLLMAAEALPAQFRRWNRMVRFFRSLSLTH